MIDTRLAASITFIAFGVNFFGAALLLLLNAGSRSVRWYLPFQLCVLLWLFAQAADLTWPNAGWIALLAFAVVMMPFMFLLFAVMDGSQRPAWQAIIALLFLAPVLPLLMNGIFSSTSSSLAGALSNAWSFVGWIGGSVLLWLNMRRQAATQPSGLRRKIFLLAFLLIAPVSVVTAIMLDGDWFIAIGVPVLTSLIMFLIFYGVTSMQFYDIEVRVRRSGDIAAQTVETERLALLGELAATIAHEVRNPLTGVRSLAQRIATDDVAADKRRQYAEVILEETGRVEKLVTNLLDLARRGSKKRDPVATATLLAPLFTDLALLASARAARRRLTIETRVSPSLAVNAPRDAVTQALLNLLLNAVNHAPEGTRVDLIAEARANTVDIVVRDEGPGVPAAERERIFEPFYTTRGEGTGLGLSVVRHLAREHDWDVSVTEAPGGGAEFHLRIPCAS
ncbi:MAG TPA: ATP-binding protein [Longimicrobiales bacterium]